MGSELLVPFTGTEPEYAHEGDAGADMRASIDGPVTIGVGESAWVPLGTSVAIPDGYFGLQAARSGLGCKRGVTLANSIGVIDSGYRGEVRAKLVNLGDEPFTVNPGDRVCQLVIVPYARARYVEATDLGQTERGERGYGSTGAD